MSEFEPSNKSVIKNAERNTYGVIWRSGEQEWNISDIIGKRGVINPHTQLLFRVNDTISLLLAVS
jgi:hypothetical protein